MTNRNMLEDAEPAIAPLPGPTSPPPRILLVDDDGELRRLNTKLLLNSGYEVEAVQDGAVAWDALCAETYDLMITDNMMPRLTGVELLKKLYATHMTLPVIMATGINPTRTFTPSPWLRPEAILLKPYTPAELLRTVEEVLRATDGGRAEIAPPPNGPGQPTTDGLQL